MKAFLTVFLGALLVAGLSATPVDIEERASNCNFLPNCDGKQKGDKFAIPCEGYCSKYYECDEQNTPKQQQCGPLRKFSPTELQCQYTGVDCDWYKAETTASPSPSPNTNNPPPTNTRPTNTPAPATTSKPDGATTTSCATVLLVGAAGLAVMRGLL